MLVVVIGGTLLSAWLGWLMSARAIRPVLRLAQAVEQLPLRPMATTLSADYGRDGSVSDAGVAIGQSDPQANAERIRRSDLGMGFVFVERLSRALGWRLEQQVSPDAGLSIWLGLRSGD